MIFTLLALAPTLPAQSAQLTGTVKVHPSGSVVPGASVRIVGSSNSSLTDAAGRFILTGLTAGLHELEVSRSGISVVRQSVTILASGQSTVDVLVALAPQELAAVRVVGARADASSRFAGSVAISDAHATRSMQPKSANDVLRALLGVHVQEEEGMGLRANIGIRGLDPDRSRTLLVLEDGMPVSLNPYGEPEMYYSPPIERMERVELLKGSGSILFGPQTVGGVLNYVTADAPVTPGGTAQFQRGTGGSQLARLSYGGSWDNARGLLHFFQKSTDNLAGLEMSVRDFTGKLGVRLGKADAGVKFSAYDELSNSTYVGLTDSLYQVNPFQPVAPSDRLRVSRTAISGTHEIPLGDRAVLRTGAYSYQTTRDWQRQDYTYNSTGNRVVLQNSTGNRNRTFEVAGVEPRLTWAWSGGEMEAGVRFHYEWARDQHINGQNGESRTGITRDDETRTGHAYSAFVQNRFALGDQWQITPGVRLESFSFERHVLRTRVRRETATGATNNAEDVSIRNSDSVSEIVPGIGASWSASPQVQLFAGVHRGFAPPRTKDALVYENPLLSANEQVPVPVSLQLDAEESWNYELGVRLSPKPYLSLEATAYMLDFANQIIAPSLSGGSASQLAFANQGETRHTGVEAGASFDVGKLAEANFSLLLSVNHSVSDAVFAAERIILNAVGEQEDVNGNRLPYAPRSRSHASLDFNYPDVAGLRLDLIRAGEQYSDNFETRTGSANGRVGLIPAYSVVDLSGSWSLPFARSVELLASIKNIGDRKYIASRRPEGIKVGAPRMITTGFRFQY